MFKMTDCVFTEKQTSVLSHVKTWCIISVKIVLKGGTGMESIKEEIEKLKKEDEEKKDAIKNMKKTLNYLQKSYQDMAVFKSSYEIGAEYEGEE